MLRSAVSSALVLLYLMLAIQLVFSYTTGGCLQGFMSTIPPERSHLHYASLTNDEYNMKTFLFPSTAFLCNGTLQELAVPYVVDIRDSLVWHTNLTAAISVWRPTEIGHTEVVQFQLTVHLPGGNDESLYVAEDTHSGAVIVRPLKEVTVQRGDIIGVTLSPKGRQDNIPLLLRRSAGSGGSEDEGCGSINATHNCNMIYDKIPLVAVNLTLSQDSVPPIATVEGIKPTAAHSCRCSHDVHEVTRMSTVYLSVCSTMGAAHYPSSTRQPSIPSTATHGKPDNTQTDPTATISTGGDQGATTSTVLANVQTHLATSSVRQLPPTLMTPAGHAPRGPHTTGSVGAQTEHNVIKGGPVCEGILIATSAVLGAAMGFLLTATVILSVFVALLTMKVKQLKRSRNMQGLVIKTDNTYIDIEQKDKGVDSNDTDPKQIE